MKIILESFFVDMWCFISRFWNCSTFDHKLRDCSCYLLSYRI